MKRSLSLSRYVVAMSLLVVHAGCNGTAENKGTEGNDTVANSVTAIASPVIEDSVVTKPDTIVKSEPKKQGTAITHQSENDRKLDSIKKAKKKDKVQVNREINHASENDNLLDSIKQAKRKSKK